MADRRRRRPLGRRRRQTIEAVTESYRIMRTNLLVAVRDIDRPTIMVTSALAGEGKTCTVANLAPALALAGQRVVVVDLDLRRPDIHRTLGLPNDRGAADVLRGDASLSDCLQYVGVEGEPGEASAGMYVLTGGSAGAEGGELIAGRNTSRLLDTVAEQSDLVLVDSPPVLAVADSLTLARMVSGVVLVIEAGRTPIPTVHQAKDALIRNQARMLGLVVSKVESRSGVAVADGYYSTAV